MQDDQSNSTSTPEENNVVPPLSQPPTPNDGFPQTAPVDTNRRKKRLTVFIAAILTVLVIIAGTAAAYFGYVVPNRPENILKKAAENALQATEGQAKGEIEFSGDGNAATVAFTSKSNSEKKIAELALELKMNGISVPLDVRYVEESLFVRVGDIGTLQSVLTSYASSMGVDPAAVAQIFTTLEQSVVNKWIEIDKTVIGQSEEAKCALDSDWRLSDQDVNIIKSAYDKNQFVSVKSHSDDKVEGKDAIKYELTFDNEKAKQFGHDESLEDLSLYKTLTNCLNASTDDSADVEELENGEYTLTVWVDKGSKQFSKFMLDTETEDVSVSIEALLTYDPVTVDKPEDATPVMEVISELQRAFGDLFAPGQDTITTFDETDVNFD